MVYDPEPLDENDPGVQEEMFAQHHYQGLELEDIPRMLGTLRKKYAEYLNANEA
jgi:protein required for attachment to host cells